jgi:hypothetical protein
VSSCQDQRRVHRLRSLKNGVIAGIALEALADANAARRERISRQRLEQFASLCFFGHCFKSYSDEALIITAGPDRFQNAEDEFLPRTGTAQGIRCDLCVSC